MQAHNQRDQMCGDIILKYLAIYNNHKVPHRIIFLPTKDQNFSQIGTK